ncbi:MAG: hypothetical protein R2785_02785 [Flavobacteriaceae bacterium]
MTIKYMKGLINLIPNSKFQNQKPETRNQKSETRNQKPEIRNQKSEIRNQKPEIIISYVSLQPEN